MGSQVSVPDIEKNKEICFTIHGKKHHVAVGDDIQGCKQKITPQTSLLTYLRDVALQRDTKAMCREGGCGACIVTATMVQPRTGRKVTMAVNSCLVPVLACHNWSIYTVHGIGNRDMGYHPIQTALAKYNGTQCGFCTPGMAMNMFALTQSKTVLTMEEIEDSFGGNICRCTGYRPIMDAFKSLADDADPALKNKFPDIEDLRICQKTQKLCEGECPADRKEPFYLDLGDDLQWYKVYSISDILKFFRHVGNEKYRLVAGNTAQGVYKIINPPKFWVDIRSVKELANYKIDNKDNLVLGANMSISDTMELMKKLAEEEKKKFWYLQQMWNHLDLVATVPVRNIGTLAGNLSTKHDHHEFPSDVFLIFETVGAKITIVREDGNEVQKTVAEYINYDMNKCVMKSITLPPLKKDTHFFLSYKIMPRAQNAHAEINAGFLIEHQKDKVKNARIVYGGINPTFIHATLAEKYLADKNLHTNDVLQGVLAILETELKPNHVLPDPGPEFRKDLAMNLYYKFILATAPEDKLSPGYESGGQLLEHKLLTGTEFYDTNPKMFPVTQPVEKIEAIIQASGEAQYVDDMPPIPGELFGAYVLAEAPALSKLKYVDTTEALALPGVVSFISRKDVPGKNIFTPAPLSPVQEQLFVEDTVEYNGQPIGVILADTYECAVNAATKVKVTYEKSKKGLYTIQEVLESKDKDRIKLEGSIVPTKKGNNVKHTLNGVFNLPGQYHYHMETLRCLCVPTDNGGIDMYPSSQWMDQCQMAASQATKLPMDKIYVSIKRVGGGYGAKISRATQVATACAIATFVSKRPVRLNLPLDINMKCVGKRFPTQAKYEVGVNDKGVIQYLKSDIYQAGALAGMNESLIPVMPHYMASCYNTESWDVKAYNVKTDMAGNCFCRAPCATEAIGLIESIMDHISYDLSLSPVEVRKVNFSSKAEVPQMLPNALEWMEYNKNVKEVEDFNSKNRWMKKGLSIVSMDYAMLLFNPFSALVSIYAGDGTVCVSHGGIEIGQGINTKVVQVCAHELGIPMNMISVRPANTLTSPNNFCTGGSITSEGVCLAMIVACKTLLKRLAPVRDGMINPTWEKLVWQASQQGIELVATSFPMPVPPMPNNVKLENAKKLGAEPVNEYPVPGVCLAQVQVDLLTGDHVVEKVDLLEDLGQSISPGVDVGQVEGGFVMGLGLYTCEDLIYDQEGKLLTDNTWYYKVPTVKDVAQNMRIMFQHDSNNPKGVLNSKGCAEPALCLSISIPCAIRNALDAAKKDVKNPNKSFIDVEGPFTTEFKLMHSSSNYKDFKL